MAIDLEKLKAEIKKEVLTEIRRELFPPPDRNELLQAIRNRDRKTIKKYNEARLKELKGER